MLYRLYIYYIPGIGLYILYIYLNRVIYMLYRLYARAGLYSSSSLGT